MFKKLIFVSLCVFALVNAQDEPDPEDAGQAVHGMMPPQSLPARIARHVPRPAKFAQNPISSMAEVPAIGFKAAGDMAGAAADAASGLIRAGVGAMQGMAGNMMGGAPPMMGGPGGM